jgi:predicted lipoprotein
MAKAMVSRSISNHSVILVRVAVGVVGKVVAVEDKAAGVLGKVVARAAGAVVRVRVDPVENSKGVLESGTSAVRGSQARMAGLPRLTRHRGPLRNQMPQPVS